MNAILQLFKSPKAQELSPSALRIRFIRRWIIPIITVGIAAIFRYSLDNILLQEAPFLLLLSAITISAYFGSLHAGLFATGLALIAALAFMHPPFDFLNQIPARQLRTGVFIIEGTVITLLCTALNNARARSDASADEARNLQQLVSDAADREQQRIGQDLHDDLGQFLTGVALAAENHARHVSHTAPDRATEARALVQMINQSINRTRQLARGLAPITIEPDSLVLLLAELQERTAEVSRRDIRFEVNGNPPDLLRTAVLNLYRIAQEAVNNALKHSGAHRIDLTLTVEPDRLILEVADNGRGFDINSISPGNGMGLSVLKFRARAINAHIDILRQNHPEPNPGTLIRCTMPTSS